MKSWYLNFSGGLSWEALEQAMSEVVTALLGASHPWVEQQREAFPDENYGAKTTFKAVFRRPDATLTEEVYNGPGNPRDGYGYSLTVNVALLQRELTLRATQTSYEPTLTSLSLTISAPEATDVETIRQALRRSLGEAREKPQAYQMAQNIAQAKERHPDLARLWLQETLNGGPQPHSWSAILALADELLGASTERLVQRLREAPQQESAWREAAASPPEGFTLAQINAVLRRFQPTLPKEAAWRKLEDGVGPVFKRQQVVWNIAGALWAKSVHAEAVAMPSQREGELQINGTIRAQWMDGPLPIFFVEQTQTMGSFEQPRERLFVAYLWGAHEEDHLILMRKVLLPNQEGELCLGDAVCVMGSADFQKRAEAALKKVSEFPWVPMPFGRLFEETTLRDLSLIDHSASPRAQVIAMLRWLKISTPEAEAAINACTCKATSCEHAKLLQQLRGDIQRREGFRPPRVFYELTAGMAAVDAAISSLHREHDVARGILNVERLIAQRDALPSE